MNISLRKIGVIFALLLDLALLLEKRSKDILARYYRNQRLPDLDIFGSLGLNGLDSEYDATIEELTSGEQHSWEVGLRIKIPVGNRTNKGNYYKAKYEVQQIETSLKDIRKDIVAETREAWRAAKLSLKRIGATEKTYVASLKRFEAEEGKFKIGLATLNDVLEFQKEYTDALFEVKKARIDYVKSLITLRKIQGELPWIQQPMLSQVR